MRVPNLFIIGAMKAGTTSLHHYLAGHSQVFMCEPKEPGYFVPQLNLSRGADWYLGLFREAGDARVVGESSTHYAKLPTYSGVAERIRAFNPEARIVYLMRDPLQRIVSHYFHNVRNLFLEAERRGFVTAVAEDPEYFAFSDYTSQLEPWFRLFGRDRVYCMVYEEMIADPVAVVDRLRRWLELDGPVPDQVFAERWNARPAVMRQARGLGLLNRVAHSRLWSGIAPLVPRSLRRRAGRLATREVDQRTAVTEPMLEPFRPWALARVESLSRLLGRSFPHWIDPIHA